MGILEKGASKALDAIGAGDIANSLFSKKVQNQYRGPDFESGFEITEVVNGQEITATKMSLKAFFMPLQPFEFGGSQRIIKENYVGNSESVVHVLGAEESDLSIRGRLWAKNLANSAGEFDNAIRDFQQRLDQVRIRGNLLKLSLGAEWLRYGFLQETKFTLKTLRDIDYELRFVIVSFTLPKNNKFNSIPQDISKSNSDLSKSLDDALSAYSNVPDDVPQTFADILNDAISDVAGAIGLVTDFVDTALTELEDISKSANRAIGLIKNARTTIVQARRRIGTIATSYASMGANFTSEAAKAAATINNLRYVDNLKASFVTQMSFLATLQARYAALKNTVPFKRHLVKENDTLHNLSIKYYQNPDHWKRIYDHNKLTNTVLETGAVLEIPKI